MNGRRWLTILLLTAASSVRAERLPVRIYSSADGLAHNTVQCIVKDSRGFLWFCTPAGLSRFDGYAFRTFDVAQGLPAAGVNDLLETKAGDYWAATDNGLVRLDQRGWPAAGLSRIAEPTGTAGALPLVIPPASDRRSRTMTVLHEAADGAVWVGTGNGLFRLVGGRDVVSMEPVEIGLPAATSSGTFPEQRIIAALAEDGHGALWIGTPNALYRRWPDGRTARYTMRDGLPAEFVSSLLEDRSGGLWVGTRTGGLFRIGFDQSAAAPVVELSIHAAHGLPDNWVTSLFESSDSRFWIGTAFGLAELLRPGDGSPPAIRAYTARQGLRTKYVGAIGEDLGGNVWAASDGVGLLKLTPTGFTSYTAGDGIDNVSAVFEDQAGNLCFRGLVLSDGRRIALEGAKLDLVEGDEPIPVQRFGCFDGTRFRWFIPDALTYWGWVGEGVTLQSRHGEWWFGSQEGVFRYAAVRQFVDIKAARPLAVYKTEDGLAAIQTYRLFEDSRGDVWISTISSPIRGLSRFERSSGRLLDMARLPGLPSQVDDLARSIGEDPSGNVWLGFNSGVARYTNGAISFFTTRDGLPAGAILHIHVDRAGRLWLASEQGGLIRVDSPQAPVPDFVKYTTADGLSSNSLVAMAEDREGHLYVGGGQGIDRFDPETGRVRHFTASDGLEPGILRAAFRDRQGALWFGMSNGLARLAPSPEKETVAPPILISGLRIAGVSYRVSPFGESDLTVADLSPNLKQVEIDFVGLGFAAGEVLRYQYKLEGADGDWGALSARRTVTYANLAPGRYRFSVRAVSSEGLESAPPATLRFTILPPFWQRWWFVAGLAVVIGCALTLTYRYRVARLLEVANMRTHIATDLHDDIGANLTRISLLSEVARRTRDDVALVSIATIARESVSSMSDIVWAVNPRRESLLDLIRRMRQHADELFTLRGIALRFDAPPGGEALRLRMDVRRDLLLIFKEAVSNAARHSRCTAVQITLRVDHRRLVLGIADDGVGFDPSVESPGNGLTSMRTRAARMHGDLRIVPGAPSGTSITLSVPV
jgi:ligand-binding sensor domain-containing protein/two-component sensor histidine kinase